MLSLPERLFNPEGLEFYGKINLLKAGLLWADRVTTVSPTYSEEIKTAEFGLGLEVFFAKSKGLTGILNGLTTNTGTGNRPAVEEELRENQIVPARRKTRQNCSAGFL